MSKRSYAELNYDDTDSVSLILDHAEGLLQAAKALKEELKALHNSNKPNDQIASIVERHNKKIASAVQLLTEDESQSHKVRKLDGSNKSSTNGSTALIIPSPVSLTRWTPQDIPGTGLPSLPPILDPALEQAALTHSGMVTKPTDMSYERLEWIGDAYLYLMSSSFIYQTFPKLSAGRCSQLRERLIKNETLSTYTVQYGINKRTKFPSEFDLRGRIGGSQASQNAKKKVLGDVFEAYVAAIILGDPEGLSRTSPWLKSLWSAMLAHEIRSEFRSQTNILQDRSNRSEGGEDAQNTESAVKQDLNPKVVLSQLIGTKGVKITYSDIGQPKKDKHTGKLPWYTVGVFFDGLGERNLQLGIGGALSKKEAGAIAARQAMDNKALMARLQKKKEEAVKSAQLAESAKEEYDNWS
ncbi:ribonuclease III [Hypoxylon sp. FL1150]|nr:ribonuclease III [Hypoxylon sp. FL1150]